MRRLIQVLAAVGLSGCSPRTVPVAPVPVPGPVEVWVDASAAWGGDGTEARPHRALGEALARGQVRCHLRPGLYPGPFRLAGGTAIDGPESAVLYAEGGEAAVVTAEDASLAGVSLQGGAVGLRARGRVRAEGIHLSGQRQVAVEVQDGELELRQADVRATISEVVGVSVEGGRVAILGGTFSGPFRRAVRAERPEDERGPGAEVTLDGVRFEGAVTAVQLVGVRGHLRAVSAAGGRGPAIFVARGKVDVAGLEVDGHEYALLSREANLEVTSLRSRRAERAGVALVGGRALIEDLVVSESGSSGAVNLVRGEVTIRRFRIERAASYGMLVRSATIAIADGEISRVAAEPDGLQGDGIQLRQVRGTVERVVGLQLAGSGLVVAEGSEVSGADLRFELCRWGGVVVETLSTFTGRSLAARECGAALAVPTEATASVAGLTSTRNEQGAVWADCAQGARVTLRALVDDAPGRLPRCVRLEH